MSIEIRKMTIDDYDKAYELWSTSEGMSLSDDDGREEISLYLRRNDGMCFVAVDAGVVVGTVLCGHDGRRGILRHLAVLREYRKNGIARRLVFACLEAIAADGIKKCNIFVMDYNVAGIRFWEHIGAHHLEYDWRTLQLPTCASLHSEIK
jgi:N-acetylglutamate synthase